MRQSAACRGPNHADFSANGQYLLVTCEFSGVVLRIATLTHRITGTIRLGSTSMPQDVPLSPDGRVFYVALMGRNRVALVDGGRLRIVGEIKTSADPHGLYPSRDATRLYVSDRGAGAVSVLSFATRRIVATGGFAAAAAPTWAGCPLTAECCG